MTTERTHVKALVPQLSTQSTHLSVYKMLYDKNTTLLATWQNQCYLKRACSIPHNLTPGCNYYSVCYIINFHIIGKHAFVLLDYMLYFIVPFLNTQSYGNYFTKL